MIRLKKICNYIPNEIIDIEDQLLSYGCSKAEIKVYKKIYRLQYVPKEINASFSSFIKNPLLKILNESNIEVKSLKYLIHTHTSRVSSSFGNSIMQDIKNELGLFHTQVFSISLNNCASIITALAMAQILLKSEASDAKVIIITADLAFTPFLQVIPHVSVMGDASSAILLSKCDAYNHKHRLLGYASQIYGRYAAGSWMSKALSLEFEYHYATMVVNTIEQALNNSKLILSDIKLILPHNVNYTSWEKILLILGIDKSKCYLDNIARYGHCFGADIFINLNEAIDKGA